MHPVDVPPDIVPPELRGLGALSFSSDRLLSQLSCFLFSWTAHIFLASRDIFSGIGMTSEYQVWHFHVTKDANPEAISIE